MSVHDSDEHSAGGHQRGRRLRPPASSLFDGSSALPDGRAGRDRCHGGLGQSAGCGATDVRRGQYGHLQHDLSHPYLGAVEALIFAGVGIGLLLLVFAVAELVRRSAEASPSRGGSARRWAWSRRRAGSRCRLGTGPVHLGRRGPARPRSDSGSAGTPLRPALPGDDGVPHDVRNNHGRLAHQGRNHTMALTALSLSARTGRRCCGSSRSRCCWPLSPTGGVPRWLVWPVIGYAVLTLIEILSGGLLSDQPWWSWAIAAPQLGLVAAQIFRYRRRSSVAEREAGPCSGHY
jgi:hypothetical protein